MKKISKKYSGFLISAFVIMGITILFACWNPFPDEDDSHYRVFAPEVSHDAAAKPFFRSFHYLYKEIKENNLYDFDSINSGEWMKFFYGTVRKDDIDYLLYKSRIGEIDSLINYFNDHNFIMSRKLQRNSLLLYTDKKAAKEFLFYLGFAKRCEPFSTYAPGWYDNNNNDPRNNKAMMQYLIEGGLKQITNSKTDFIRERYIFQIERLYFQAGNYSECYSYYSSNLNNIKISESIKYRAMGYAAGALYKMKRFGESNYLFSILYNCYLPMKTTSYLSFAPEESDWNVSLNLAKNTRERSALAVAWNLQGSAAFDETDISVKPKIRLA